MKGRMENEHIMSENVYILLQIVRDLVVYLFFIGVVVYNFNLSVIPSPSMRNTLTEGQIVLAKYLHGKPVKHGDIVMFYNIPDWDGSSLNWVEDIKMVETKGDARLIKRVIGLPGDVIELREGELYRNGEHIEEPYAITKIDPYYEPSNNLSPHTVAEGCVFCLGDNRSNSMDSRVIGDIPLERVFAKKIVAFPTF